MTSPVAGIDPHQNNFTVGVVDVNGVEIATATFANSAAGFVEAIGALTAHRDERVGIEGSASWGAHVAIAITAAGFDAHEVPGQRTAMQRRARRLDKTDNVDAVCAARALVAEPTLGPAQALEIYDPLVAKIEAVLEHRKALVATRTLMLHHIGDQIVKLPIEIRDQVPATGKIESRLRKLETIAASSSSTEVGDPFRFSRESKFAKWCGTGAVALSSGEGSGLPVKHRLDFRGNRRINSVLYIASITQQRDQQPARIYIERMISEHKTRREARRAHKRHLANRVIRRMWKDETARKEPPAIAA